MINIGGTSCFSNDWLEIHKNDIYGVFDGLFHFLHKHDPPGQQAAQGKYRYYERCKIYRVVPLDGRNHDFSKSKVAIKNIFKVFNK